MLKSSCVFILCVLLQGKGCEDVISMLRNGSAAENAATLMQGKGTRLQKKSRHRMTPGTLKFAAYHVLCLEGSKGLNVLELADKIQVLTKNLYFNKDYILISLCS